MRLPPDWGQYQFCVDVSRRTVVVINTSRPRQNGRHFPDDKLKRIFLNENVWISIKISLKFVPRSPINNIPALVQIMAWRRPGDKPLSGPMMVRLPTHICVTRPQRVNRTFPLKQLWQIYTFPKCSRFEVHMMFVQHAELYNIVSYKQNRKIAKYF